MGNTLNEYLAQREVRKAEREVQKKAKEEKMIRDYILDKVKTDDDKYIYYHEDSKAFYKYIDDKMILIPKDEIQEIKDRAINAVVYGVTDKKIEQYIKKEFETAKGEVEPKFYKKLEDDATNALLIKAKMKKFNISHNDIEQYFEKYSANYIYDMEYKYLIFKSNGGKLKTNESNQIINEYIDDMIKDRVKKIPEFHGSIGREPPLKEDEYEEDRFAPLSDYLEGTEHKFT